MFRKKAGETVKIRFFGKGLLCVAMAALCSFSVWGGKGESARAEEGDIDFRSAYATEKVLQDIEYTGGGAAAISVNACRGEYESAQIIMTARKDIQSYDAETSDLVLSGSDARFSAENITVYAEKYIEVKKNYCNNGAPAGCIPIVFCRWKTPSRRARTRSGAGTTRGCTLPSTFRPTSRRGYIRGA